MDPRDLIIAVLKAAADLPPPVVAGAAGVRDSRASCVDSSYLAFLDSQIELEPRGPEWTERLKKRRAGLSPFCDVPLVSGTVRTATCDVTVYVDPERRVVVFWEEYPL